MEIKSYRMGDCIFDYLIDASKNVALQIYPEAMAAKRKKPWEKKKSDFNPNARYSNIWNLGRIAYFHLVGQNTAAPGYTMKNDYIDLPMISQAFKETSNGKSIETLLSSNEGYMVLHRVTYIKNLGGYEFETEFINSSDSEVTLDMLSSFVLDNLSPFQADDSPNKYNFHRFYGSWSKEGRHCCQTLEELSMEKSWAGFRIFNNNERFGSLGSYPTGKFFPTAVFEDKDAGVLWGAQLAHNATWQMELTRWDDSLSFSGGLGDREFCGWKKTIKSGESFKAPKAYIAVCEGDIFDVCGRLTDMMKPAQIACGEKGIPTSFNEYCATWGTPTQEKMLAYCEEAKKYGIKYLVVDAGWCKAGCEQDGNGEWNIDKSIFPDVKEMNRIIRENGMIPGIWFEFEVTTKGSKMFEPEYDFMKLTKDGFVLKSDEVRSYWDFRREDVREYLYEKVIRFLKENDFGYIKVDYNRNIGVEIDGAESGAEALRQHQECVREFFVKMKEEIPDLVIENCASGGNRNEPSMMGITAMSSFSDAHEAVEIPYIAANLHNLMLPVQTLVWCVLRKEDDEERLVYSLAATFLGRVCLSGAIDKLDEWQKNIVKKAMDFYSGLENIIVNGKTKIYGNRSLSMRYPQGVQAVVRTAGNQILIVYHSFAGDLKPIEINIGRGYCVKDGFYAENIEIADGVVKITADKEYTAGAVLLEKKKGMK